MCFPEYHYVQILNIYLPWVIFARECQHMTWVVLLSRFLDSLHLFIQAFTQDLRNMSRLDEAYLFTICSSPSDLFTIVRSGQMACEITLSFLDDWECWILRGNDQLLSQRVAYVGLVLTPRKRTISPIYIQAILQLSFLNLGLPKPDWLCHLWILESIKLTKLLQEEEKDSLIWISEQSSSFNQLKNDFCLTWPFYVPEWREVALNVLAQKV